MCILSFRGERSIQPTVGASGVHVPPASRHAEVPHAKATLAPCCCRTRARPQVYNSYRFGFDRVYGPESTQEDVYSQSARPAVQNVLQVRSEGGSSASLLSLSEVLAS
jgi:hypothetical protein